MIESFCYTAAIRLIEGGKMLKEAFDMELDDDDEIDHEDLAFHFRGIAA